MQWSLTLILVKTSCTTDAVITPSQKENQEAEVIFFDINKEMFLIV